MPDRRGALQGAPAHRLLPQDGDEAGHRAGGEWGHRQDPLCRLHRLHPVSSQPWALSHGALSAPCWWPQGEQPPGAAWPSRCGSERCLSTQEHQPQDPSSGACPSSPVQGQGGGDPENPPHEPAENQAEGEVSPGTVHVPFAGTLPTRPPALLCLVLVASLSFPRGLFLLPWCWESLRARLIWSV